MTIQEPRPVITAHARLRTIARLADALADDWTVYEATEAALAIPTSSAAGGSDGGRSSSVPDPTAAVAISHERYYETEATITEALGHLREAQRTMRRIRQHHSTIAGTVESAVRNARCSGEMDPLCTRNAVTRDGLCSACYQRRRRQLASVLNAASSA